MSAVPFLPSTANSKISNLCKNCRATHPQVTVMHLTALKLALVDMKMAMVRVMARLIAILSLGSAAQPERLLLGHVVEMIIAVMVMIIETEDLPRHGPQEVVVGVIIMVVMANMAVDTVVPQALLVELPRGNDTTRHPRHLRVVKAMDMEDTRVADMVTLPGDIPLNRAWVLLQGLVGVRVGLVHLLGWVLYSRIMVPTDLGVLHPLLHLGTLLLHL